MSKFEELKCMLTSDKNNQLHVFGISETKLKDHKLSSTFHISGYQMPFRKDNDSNGGGGLIVFVKSGINAKRRDDLESHNISCIWLEISPVIGKSFLVGCMYRPPDSKIEWNDRFENFIDQVLNTGKEMILLGDLNKNLTNSHECAEWPNFITSLGLSQLITEPTRITANSATLIDHIYTNNEDNISHVCVKQLCISDHFGIFCNRKLSTTAHKDSHQSISYRSFKSFNEANFIYDLERANLDQIMNYEDINEMLSVWSNIFLTVVDKHAPIKQHRVKKKIQPEWLTSEIIDCIKERDKCKIKGNYDQYKLLRNKVTSMIQKSKKSTYANKIETGQNDPRTIWNIFKEFGASKKVKESNNILAVKNEENELITNNCDIANVFNDYFVSVASKLKMPIQSSTFDQLINCVSSKIPCNINFEIPETNEQFVHKYLSSLDVTKATGLDNMGPRLLKLSAIVIAPSITLLVNKSINSCTFPDVWKNAKVSPLLKSGAKDEVNNYRPISILPTLSKLIEKFVNVHLTAFLTQHNLLHKSQSGFRCNHSTESALLLMIEQWLSAINNGDCVGCVMVDFRKAFDMVDHEILLQKLNCYKFSDQSLRWFDSYLKHRKQVTSVNGSCSKELLIECGVPQGSILGPTLFLLFINDLPTVLSGCITGTDLYADDTTIYDIKKDKTIVERNLQTALNELNVWCKTNGMLLNTSKTKVMLISTRQRKHVLNNNTLSLTYDDIDLEMTNGDKILGLNINENLIWNNHFNAVSKKVSSYIWLLSQIRY
ncbi:MAG: reverse transcriptase family protein, partial [Sedimenticola sp.]